MTVPWNDCAPIFPHNYHRVTEQIPSEYRRDEEIIRLTVEQLRKDFGSHLPELHFSGRNETLFEELVAQVASALEVIQRKTPSMLQPLLYRVDVAEGSLPRPADPAFHSKLSEAIIRREFQKVLTRRFFGKKP